MREWEMIRDFGTLWQSELWWGARTQLLLRSSIDNLAFCIEVERESEENSVGYPIENYSFFLFHALISIVCYHRKYIDVYFFALLIGIQPKCHVSEDKTSQNDSQVKKRVSFYSLFYLWGMGQKRSMLCFSLLPLVFEQMRIGRETMADRRLCDFSSTQLHEKRQNMNEKRDRATFMRRIPFVWNARFDTID